MPHEKYNTKRGTSYHIQDTHELKKYINKCIICGCEGYSPVILENDFFDPASNVNPPPYNHANRMFYKNRYIYDKLTSIFKKSLELDNLGRCEDCASAMDKYDYKKG
jgi:hypothetical protein